MNKTDFLKWLEFHKKQFPQLSRWFTNSETDRWFQTLNRFNATFDGLMAATTDLQLSDPTCYPNKHLSELINLWQDHKQPHSKWLTRIKADEQRWADGDQQQFENAAADPRIDQLSQDEIEGLLGEFNARRFLSGGRQSPILRAELSRMLDE